MTERFAVLIPAVLYVAMAVLVNDVPTSPKDQKYASPDSLVVHVTSTSFDAPFPDR